jgi:hypothetical protein
MSSPHLSCQDCRIRVRASATEIELLEGSCPICGAELRAVPSPSDVLGFRSFDLDVLAEGASSDRPPAPAQPVDLVARREAALARDGFDADRWSDEGRQRQARSGGRVAGGALIPRRKPSARSQRVDEGRSVAANAGALVSTSRALPGTQGDLGVSNIAHDSTREISWPGSS